MIRMTAPGLSLLVAAILTQPAGAAEKLTMRTLEARLAEKPTGEKAAALAEDIRAWFGKDRSGRSNLVNGANPRVEGLDTAWAIEAPEAKTVAIETNDRKNYPLTRVGDTPVFAAVIPMVEGTGVRWSYQIDTSRT